MKLKFKGTWRVYQKRILDSLEFHLSDKKLHIVAAPGAGKTTLGVEVIARINRPVLILVPTNTIKNQWKERICSSFLEPEGYNLVSVNIRKPSFVTIATYQALLAAFCSGAKEDNFEEQDNSELSEEENEESIVSSKRFNSSKADEIIEILKSAKISLLCFDEAHHLRKEWWKALTYLVEELQPEQTVALTATPPYDVDYAEWQRYEELCGDIDEVISIPELVKNGDLCPHQDFIYFSLLRENEKEFINNYKAKISQFLDKLFADEELIAYFSSINVLECKENIQIEKILDNPEFYVSIASLLRMKGVKIPKSFLNLFGAKEIELPKFNLKQAKIFLNGFLYSNSSEFPEMEEKIQEYLSLARKQGLIQNKKIVLDDSVKVQKQIANSLGKLDSIVKIVELESNNLGNALRMVILADYIRANDVDNSHLGVVPIWRILKNKFKTLNIGILCGSLILLPAGVKEAFYNLLKAENIAEDCISVTEYKEDFNFIKITPKDSAKHCIVALITEMFNKGFVNVLVGTQALLGEGWDAPSINSLILSSTVSSYMLSNQMRGRAIRIDKNNPDKVSNIWHLASIQVPQSDNDLDNNIFAPVLTSNDIDSLNAGLYDLKQLAKRFEGFEAPSYFFNHEIVNGIDRVFSLKDFQMLKTLGEQRFFQNLNGKIMTLAKNREQTKQWWQKSLNLGYNSSYMHLRTGVDVARPTAKTLCYSGYKAILFSILAIVFAVCYFLIEFSVMVAFIVFIIGTLLAFIYVAYHYLRTGTVESIMKQIAIVHLETLSYLGYINTSLKKVGIHVDSTELSVFVDCENLPTEENNLLINSMKEFLDPIENPRYILIKKDKFAKFINQTDYFAIPAIFSSKKKDVQVFEKLWMKYIGPCECVYTRNFEGRKILLKARNLAFSSLKRNKSKKLSKWQ